MRALLLLIRAPLPTIGGQIAVQVALKAVQQTTGHLFPALFAVRVAVLMLFAAWEFRKTAGRTPRPVNAIQAELAAINAGDLGGRVPEPSSSGDIAGYAFLGMAISMFVGAPICDALGM